MSLKQKINSIITYLMPLSLMSSGYVNLVLFYFGLHAYDDIRRLVSVVILSIVFAFSLMKLLFLYHDYPERRRKIIALCCIPALWIIAFIVAMVRSGIQSQIAYTLGCFGIYCIPAFIFAISIAIERTEGLFIRCFKWYTLFIAPLMFFYIVRIIITPQFVYGLNNLGELDYLVIGYTLVPMLVFCILDLFLYKGKDNGLKLICIFLLWIACIFTGAKGPLLCLLAFLVLFMVLLFIRNQKDKIIFRLFAAMFSILLCFLFVYSPPSAGIYRTSIFINGLVPKVIQFTASSEEDKRLQSMLADNKSIQEVFNETIEPSDVSSTISEQSIQNQPGNIGAHGSAEGNGNKPEQAIENEAQEKPQRPIYGNGWERMFIYKLAIKEGNNNPLTGLGPMGFTLKYGMYPHNALLELVADFGYIITCVFVFAVSVLIVFLYVSGLKDVIIGCMLLYFLSCIPGEMLSGTVYSSIVVLFFLGYACALPRTSNN